MVDRLPAWITQDIGVGVCVVGEAIGAIQCKVEDLSARNTTDHASATFLDNFILQVCKHEVTCRNQSAMGEIDEGHQFTRVVAPGDAGTDVIDQHGEAQHRIVCVAGEIESIAEAHPTEPLLLSIAADIWLVQPAVATSAVARSTSSAPTGLRQG
jgi:hypothetical protein